MFDMKNPSRLRPEIAVKFLSAFDLASCPQVARWAPLALRLVVGFGFMQHGYAKLARGPESFAHILQALDVPFPHLLAWATILVELFGGLAVLLGAFVALVSIPMAAVLLVATFTTANNCRNKKANTFLPTGPALSITSKKTVSNGNEVKLPCKTILPV